MEVWVLRMVGWEPMEGWDRLRLRHIRTLGRRTRMSGRRIRGVDLRILVVDPLIRVVGLSTRVHLILALDLTRTSGLRILICPLIRICQYTEGWV